MDSMSEPPSAERKLAEASLPRNRGRRSLRWLLRRRWLWMGVLQVVNTTVKIARFINDLSR